MTITRMINGTKQDIVLTNEEVVSAYNEHQFELDKKNIASYIKKYLPTIKASDEDLSVWAKLYRERDNELHINGATLFLAIDAAEG